MSGGLDSGQHKDAGASSSTATDAGKADADGGAPGTDASADVASDAVPDAIPDAAVDASPDGEQDASPDAAVDASPDAEQDARADAVPDASHDAAADAVPDASSDGLPGDASGDGPGQDTAPPGPDTTITVHPNAWTNDPSPSFSFTSPQSPVTFECSLDAAGFAACVSPQAYPSLGEGAHQFEVRAIEGAVADPTPAIFDFTVDRTPPTFAGATTAQFSALDTGTAGWSPASDNLSAPGAIVYDVCVSSNSGDCAVHFVVAGTSPAGASSEAVPAPAQTPGSELFFVARARDQAGNSDTNVVETALPHADVVMGGYPGAFQLTTVDSPFDEFMRYTDEVTFLVPAWMLWEVLYPTDPMPTDDTRLEQLQATLQVSLGAPAGSSSVTVTQSGWQGSQYEMNALFHGAWFGSGVNAMSLSATITDAASPGVSAPIPLSTVAGLPVFGGDPAIRSLLFDNNGSTLRQRVIERDGLFQGSTLTFGFTDWRADEIVDKTKLDLQIGIATESGRGGTYGVPIYGELSYQVSVGYADDGGVFGNEVPLTANAASRFLPGATGRTVYEAAIPLGSAETQLLLYVHIKAILIADYSGYSNVTSMTYSQGQQIQLAEKWDNPNGSGTNYQFPVAPKP